MTGFGAARARFGRRPGDGQIVVEIKSVNQRFLDLKLSLPRDYAAVEAELRSLVQERVTRGRIEMYVGRVASGRRNVRVEIDVELARAYVEAWRTLKRRLGLSGDVEISFLQSRSELFRTAEAPVALDSELPALRRAARAALQQHEAARRREGTHLERDMRSRIRTLEKITRQMPERVERSVGDTRRRIAERMRELLGGDAAEGRILQEAAFLAERADVSEEIVRLESHVKGLHDLLDAAEPIGRRIEFLLQEVQREVNTVASKSNDLALTELALEAKGEIEKLREQVQNVE